MSKRTYKEAVDITIEWWVEKSFQTNMNQNNGDNSPNGGMSFMLMNTAASRFQKDVTEEKIEKFKSKLTETLLLAEGKHIFANKLSVDYDPNSILYDACKFAEINTLCLPSKTVTWINKDNEIEGRYQYGGEHFKL